MAKNILFLVTGMTSQIVTETVWALACDPDNPEPWYPDEIQVISTGHGLNQIRDRLLDKGNFNKLLQEYDLPDIAFDESCLHGICDTQGEIIEDLRTPEDNERAADAICAKIRGLTSDPETCLHVSIAGGRKTMGFYAGYALSLYGRAQDSMSHVLVDERFEHIASFYYPSKNRSLVTDRNDKVWNAQQARVWLANIPFVRMKDAIHDKHQLNSSDSFSSVVAKIGNSFSPARLIINLDRSTATFNNMEIRLPPREYAMLHWFADLRKQGKAGIRAPRIKNNSINPSTEDAAYLAQLTRDYLSYYQDLKNTDESDFGVDKVFFESVKSSLKDCITRELGLETAARFSIINSKRGEPFYLDVEPQNITIIDSIK